MFQTASCSRIAPAAHSAASTRSRVTVVNCKWSPYPGSSGTCGGVPSDQTPCACANVLGLPASALPSVHGGDGAPRPRLAFTCVCLPRLTKQHGEGPAHADCAKEGMPNLRQKINVAINNGWAGRQGVWHRSLACQMQGLCPAAPRHTGVREIPRPASEGLQSHLRGKKPAASPVGRVHVSTKDSPEAANGALSAQVADNEG